MDLNNYIEIPSGKKPKEILSDFCCLYCYNKTYKTIKNENGSFHICDKCLGIRIWEDENQFLEFSIPKYVLEK